MESTGFREMRGCDHMSAFGLFAMNEMTADACINVELKKDC